MWCSFRLLPVRRKTSWSSGAARVCARLRRAPLTRGRHAPPTIVTSEQNNAQPAIGAVSPSEARRPTAGAQLCCLHVVRCCTETCSGVTTAAAHARAWPWKETRPSLHAAALGARAPLAPCGVQRASSLNVSANGRRRGARGGGSVPSRACAVRRTAPCCQGGRSGGLCRRAAGAAAVLPARLVRGLCSTAPGVLGVLQGEAGACARAPCQCARRRGGLTSLPTVLQGFERTVVDALLASPRQPTGDTK